ncbi:MAG: hypothetical protein R3F61_10695 [Myxococcota bacterium]
MVATLAFVVPPPPWDPLLMTSGMYHYVTEFEDHSRAGILEYSIGLYDLVYYEEGLSTVVTVARNKESGNMWLANNGKVDASTTTDMPTQVLCSLLPMQYAKSTDRVLVIGLSPRASRRVRSPSWTTSERSRSWSSSPPSRTPRASSARTTTTCSTIPTSRCWPTTAATTC